jgi:hypothetical protein
VGVCPTRRDNAYHPFFRSNLEQFASIRSRHGCNVLIWNTGVGRPRRVRSGLTATSVLKYPSADASGRHSSFEGVLTIWTKVVRRQRESGADAPQSKAASRRRIRQGLCSQARGDICGAHSPMGTRLRPSASSGLRRGTASATTLRTSNVLTNPRINQSTNRLNTLVAAFQHGDICGAHSPMGTSATTLRALKVVTNPRINQSTNRPITLRAASGRCGI